MNHLRFPEKIFYEDNCASPIWMLHFTHFEKVEELLYYYYQHEESTVHEISIEKCEARLLMGKRMIEESRKRGFFTDNTDRNLNLLLVNILYEYFIYVYDWYEASETDFLKINCKRHAGGILDFQNNPYYQKAFDEEQKKLAAMHMKPHCGF